MKEVSSIELKSTKLEEVPKGKYLRVSGYIDTFSAAEFQKKVREEICEGEGFNKILLDVAGIEYLSSSGIGSLIELFKDLKKDKGSFVILSPQKHVREVITLLGFDKFFVVKYNFAEALDFLKTDDGSEIFGQPIIRACPVCNKKLKVKKAGIFKCSNCGSKLEVSGLGGITFIG